ncbi:hypothetical protein SLEP1_g30786 [Rubroshorea leprosula]|uniref:PGG domain-containing protein n=1 Tax=Rubroshorea leprosula TaxID=152421 RepID=A0AAV5KAE0_9ROSI|nr:hypothetical protein SLEP1_g30786 [Rubroshorea leprosula]
MEIATLPPNTIVPEVLGEYNYERWSILIENYLAAQDVWDVIEPIPTTEEINERVWNKKNALALHAIKISCDAKAFDLIKNKKSARDAWKALHDMQNAKNTDAIALQSLLTELPSILHKFICNGSKRKVEQFFYDNLNERSDQRTLKSALHVAMTVGQKDIARFLYGQIDLQEFSREDYGFILLEECITKKIFRIEVDVDLINPSVAANDASGEEHSCYQSCLQFLESLISQTVITLVKSVAKQICDLKSRDVYAGKVVSFVCGKLRDLEHNHFVQNRAVEAIFLAIKNGIPEIALEIAKAKEDILWTSTDPEDSRTMFACAIAHRQEEVAKFLYERKADKFYDKFYDTDEDGNNNLHLAAKLAPHFQLDRISDAASQLQSEVRWFKSVKAIVPRFYNEQKNKNGETPYQVFAKEHKNLLKEAKERMKKTAESSTVIGALIITIMFAAAFTVPGGNDQNTGFPIFLNTTAPAESFTVTPFKVFITSDAISLSTAASSVLIFLGILTARYAYEDFLISLPMKLIFGLSFLFISIATMTVAFCATLCMMLRRQQKEVIPITLFAGILIMCLVVMQLPLLLKNMALTPRPNIFDRKTAIAQLFEFLAGLKTLLQGNKNWLRGHIYLFSPGSIPGSMSEKYGKAYFICTDPASMLVPCPWWVKFGELYK